MRKVAKRALVLSTLLVALSLVVAIATSGITHRMRAEIIVRKADIGIPGITKTYEATLTNRGLLAARVTRCDFIDDTMSPGTMVAYAIQRWNQGAAQWERVVELGSEFCKPYPLGIAKA